LSLLSSLYQKPISWSVAATGAIAGQAKIGKAKTADGKEINISAGDNLPIRGLKAKIEGAIKKEINRFVLSKYQTSPNLLSLKHKESGYAGDEIRTKEKWVLKDDYQKEVSPEIKAKIKEIHWTENIKELRELLLAGKLS